MKFYKYSGSGNDFIMLDNRKLSLSFNANSIQTWCDRRYGIGADGIILIGSSQKHDFSMRIFNSDGSEAEMCGNGARCSIHFVYNVLEMNTQKSFKFDTMNGTYEGEIQKDNYVQIKMTELYDLGLVNVDDLSSKNALFLNTGVPHTVIQVSSTEDVNVQSVGAAIRQDRRFKAGTNVCFFDLVSAEEQTVRLRVYERGVEGETLCCGTGVMATAVACSSFFGWTGEIKVLAKGGDLLAKVDKDFLNLYFGGEVKKIFHGELLS